MKGDYKRYRKASPFKKKRIGSKSTRYIHRRRYSDINATRLLGDDIHNDLQYQLLAPYIFISPKVLAKDEACMITRNKAYDGLSPFDATQKFAKEYCKAAVHWEKTIAIKDGRDPRVPKPLWDEWWQSPERYGLWTARQEFDRHGLLYNAAKIGPDRCRIDTALSRLIQLRILKFKENGFPRPQQLFSDRKGSIKNAAHRYDEDYDTDYKSKRDVWKPPSLTKQLDRFMIEVRNDTTDYYFRDRCGETAFSRMFSDQMKKLEEDLMTMFGTKTPHEDAETKYIREGDNERQRAKRRRDGAKTVAEKSRANRAAVKDDPEATKRSNELARLRNAKKRAIDKIKKGLPGDRAALEDMLSGLNFMNAPEDDYTRKAMERRLSEIPPVVIELKLIPTGSRNRFPHTIRRR